MTLDPKHEWGTYNMVCLFSLQEKEKEALSWLKKTLELRKITYLKIESDTDLDYIREM
ncbi:MAG: hypothetical protein P1U70_23600 [Saprospiraceae bacterium]|nr:hypothetical protein [Saprospiraceae bacterium]